MDLEHLTTLLEGVRNQVPGAIDRLLGHLREHLRRRAGWLAPLDASDIAQETCVRVVQYLDTLRDEQPERLIAYVNRMLNQVLVDAWRRRDTEKRGGAWERVGGELIDGVAGNDTSPSERVVRNEEEERVLRAMAQLPERERRVIELRFLAGKSNAEVARELGVTEAHARVILFRATGSVRELLGEQS